MMDRRIREDRMWKRIVCGAFLVLLAVSWVSASEPPEFPSVAQEYARLLGPDLQEDWSVVFTRTEVMIPMRDGVRLYTHIYQPKNSTGPLPIIYEPTPYGLHPDANGFSARLRGYRELVRDGYIFAFQDLRGRFSSEGEFDSSPALTHLEDPMAVDDSSDAWDTIDWLVKNVPDNNGRVGTLGVSYGGYLTTRALADPHPALRAASPQASCGDMFIGDDWHHNGAFRLEYSFGWLSSMERSKGRSPFDFDRYDAYQWFLELGPLSNVDKKYLHGESPGWSAFAEHPNLDDYWIMESCSVLPHISGEVTVPTLNVAGWFDAEDFYGPMTIYAKYEERDPDDLNYLVVGPWYHGGWVISREGRGLGPLDFGGPTAKYFREQIQSPWFAYWLKDEGELDLPEVTAFQTGSNLWQEFERWPPRETTPRSLYLHADGALSFEPPAERGEAAFDSYVSDPDHPVPYRPRPINRREGWPEWQLADQRFVDHRPDVLSWESEPLEEDLVVTGDIVARLFASTSGEDCDWVVKLIDVFPEDYPANPRLGGYQLMVAGEVFRARYRSSFWDPEPVTPDQVTEYSFSLRDRNHRFLAGHRIMVQIQSSWFPMIDRNPQSWVDNIYLAEQEDFQKATQKVYRSERYPTHILLPVREP
jgi:putative CocE/NonD family hydrolase